MLRNQENQVKSVDDKLSDAAASGDVTLVNEMIQAGADINTAKDNGMTALMMAASRGYPDVVKVLIAGGANLEATIENGNTALMIAADNDYWRREAADNRYRKKSGVEVKDIHAKIIRILLEHGANTDAKNKDMHTGLFISVKNDFAKAIEILLANNANLAPDCNHNALAYANNLKLPAAVYAIKNIIENTFQGRLVKINYEGDIPAELICPVTGRIMNDPVTLPNGTTYDRDWISLEFKQRRLFEGTTYDNDYIFDLEYNKRFKIHRSVMRLGTNAWLAERIDKFVEGKEAEAKKVMKAKQNKNLSALAKALFTNELDRVMKAVEAGADVNEKYSNWNPLILASSNCSNIIVAYLLSKGADVNAISADGKFSTLIAAVSKGKIEVLETLLQYHPYLDGENSNNKNKLLEIAAANGSVCCFYILLKHGAVPSNSLRARITETMYFDSDSPEYYRERLMLTALESFENGTFEGRLQHINYENIDPQFICALSKKIINDPVTLSDGVTYDRFSVERLFDENGFPPYVKVPGSGHVIKIKELYTFTNPIFKNSIENYVKTLETEAVLQKQTETGEQAEPLQNQLVEQSNSLNKRRGFIHKFFSHIRTSNLPAAQSPGVGMGLH